MDFDLSKENIQPLRGGRNVAQLEVGLQAQHNPQYHHELLQQKQQFENTIRNYTGDDPLENYYQYIFWVEQSYPKHGHEGSFVNLLEDCLGRFENDPRYQNDRRICSLWIKYIDMQHNQTELYQLLYTKRICIGCGDMYKAWAYYYEAAGDYKRADKVFKLGMDELAQPYQDLKNAYDNFVYSTGFQLLNNGVDVKRLAEQRQALTKLQTYKSGHVASVRVASTSGVGAGVLPVGSLNVPHRTNATVNIHEEDYQDILLGAGAPPASILTAVKRDAPKENMIKAGVWTGGNKKMQIVHKSSNIPIHEDTPLPPHILGIQLPSSFVSQTNEDFTDWNVSITLPEPDDPNPNKIPMYCKHLCYMDPTTEYSIEEIRARRYMRKMKRQLSIGSTMEMDHVMQRSTSSMECSDHSTSDMNNYHLPSPNVTMSHLHSHMNHNPPVASQTIPYVTSPPKIMLAHPSTSAASPPMIHQPLPIQYNQHVHNTPTTHNSIQRHHSQQFNQTHQHSMQMPHHSMNQPPPTTPQQQHSAYVLTPYRNMMQHPHHQSMQQQHSSMNHESMHQSQHSMQQQQHQQTLPHSMIENSQYLEPKTYTNLPMQSPYGHAHLPLATPMRTITENQIFPHHQEHFSHHQIDTPSPKINHDQLWNVGDANTEVPVIARPPLLNFSVYESPISSYQQHQVEAKGNAMKTPIKMLNDDELAETGSRGGLDIAAAAQPTDGAKRVFEDEDSYTGYGEPYKNDFNFSANTELFNLNAMHVSTPENKQPLLPPNEPVEVKSTKKRLFSEQGCVLSAIMEEKSTYSSSASSGTGSGTLQKSAFGISKPNQMQPVSEQRNFDFNLSQNMKANAELRLKLLGMDCESGPNSPNVVPSANAYDYRSDNQEFHEAVTNYEEPPMHHVPYPVLNVKPTDPFTNRVLDTFLRHVNFPGRHHKYYVQITGVPKLCVKKEPCYIANERFIVDKLLGKGSYGNVYRATRCDTGAVIALKIQKPPNKWEFYICREIQARLADHPLKENFMNVHLAYFSDQASVLVSDVHYGSMLNLINIMKVNLGYGSKHHLSIYLTGEMMKLVQALHQVKIIHADIKPDNFLIMLKNDTLRLQLIDFGCSIDMSLMPEGTSFMRKVKTDSFQCCEMKDDRPWSYHTDLFCIAATAHVLLLEHYIEMKKVDNQWYITRKIPRYYRDELWSLFFNTLMNMQEGLPNLDLLIAQFSEAIDPKELRSAINYITNSFKNR